MKKSTLLLLFLSGIITNVLSQETVIQYLSGTDKDHTVSWEFFCTKGRNSGSWTNIPVPSQWERQGFGTLASGSQEKSNEQGMYRYSFPAAKEWQNKKVLIVFEGVMTDAEVKVNGKSAGDIHQGGFYQFSYDITQLLRYDESNLLEVTVSKQSSNSSVEHTEHGNNFMSCGGIYRPVYLKIVPDVFIDRVAIDAKFNGNFTAQVYTQNTQPNHTIEVQVQDLAGKNVGAPLQAGAGNNAEIKKQFSIFKTWNPENPNLYQAIVSIKDGANVLHTVKARFGFRTAEMRDNDGFYVNGTKVIFKGVNLRSAQSGLMSTREAYMVDISMIKDLNMNAVRLSNYPPDPDFLDLCDSMGLFVINELSGWQASYDNVTGKKLVKELVQRDVNHPSVVIWSNGSEGVANRELDAEYRGLDVQQRPVIHPIVKLDADTKKNADFNSVANSILYGTEVYYPSEFANGMYNGGHATGLDDFWSEMLRQPKFSGGFLWSFRDEGMERNGAEENATSTDPETVLNMHRQKEASFYAIKEIWSPVVFFDTKSIPTSFNGNLNIENRYTFTNLNKCNFTWKLVLFPKATEKRTMPIVKADGTALAPYIGPGEKGVLKIGLPASFVSADALVLTATDAKGREIFTWSWPVRRPADIVKTIPEVTSISTIMKTEDENFLSVVTDGINYIFDKKTGNLAKVFCGKRDIPFAGPIMAGLDLTLTEFKYSEVERSHIVEASYKGDNWLTVKWTFRSGDLPKMEYQYAEKGPDYMGITFKYPEEKVVGIKWMGRGPHQVWKNRLKGMQLGVWEKSKANNDAAISEETTVKDFKGWHSDVYWVQVQTAMGNFTIYADQPNLFLQVFKLQRPAGVMNEFNNPPFPENGAIGFMHSISGLGTKSPASGATASKSLRSVSDEPMGGTLWLDFRF